MNFLKGDYLLLVLLAAGLMVSGCFLPARNIWDEEKETINAVNKSLLVPGEKLTFDIKAGILTLGEAELTIKVSAKNRENLILSLYVNSTHPLLPSLSYSYKSTVNKDDFSTRFFEMEEMKKSETKKSITFEPNYSTHKGEFKLQKKKSTKTGILSFGGKVYDYVSLLYMLRASFSKVEESKKVWRSKEVSLFTESEIINIKIKNLAKRTITLPKIGKFKGYILKPRRDFEGIFFRKGDILLWIDDTYFLPLKIIIKLPFGTGTIELKKVENTQTAEVFFQ